MFQRESTAKQTELPTSSIDQATEEFNKKGGSEFMSLKWTVIRVRQILRRDISPLQNYLLDDISLGTIYMWKSKNEFDIRDLATSLNVKPNRVYELLKDLEEKKVIVREPTRYPKREVLGLNPEMFGQILTETQTQKEKFRLRSVPTGKPTGSEKPSEDVGRESDSLGRESDIDSRESDSGSRDSDQNKNQPPENKKENSPLDPLDSFRSLRGKTGDSDSRSRGPGTGDSSADGFSPMPQELKDMFPHIFQKKAAVK